MDLSIPSAFIMSSRDSKPNGVRARSTADGAAPWPSSAMQHNLAYGNSLVDTSAEDADDTRDEIAQRTYNNIQYEQAQVPHISSNITQEDAELRTAVEASLNANNVVHSLQQRVPDRQEVKSARQRPDLQEQERIDASLLCMSNDLERFQDPKGDTLIYIGPPPKAANESPGDYAYIFSVFSKLHRVKSSVLKELGSKKIDDCLGPRSVRVERRFRKEELLQNVDTTGIKYYVDWRPPNEEDEAIILVLDLTCCQGILRWHLAQDYYQISKGKVMGKDAFGSLLDVVSPIPLMNKSQLANDPQISTSGVSEQTGDWSADTTGDKAANTNNRKLSTTKVASIPISLEPEYSALRHRTGLLRLLHAIHGHNPRLDSAPKCWTFFALAKYFKIATHDRLSRWIRAWLLYNKNDNFIQCNPEATLRIGIGIEDPFLTRVAFSLLVGEKALMNIAAESDSASSHDPRHSQHGRTIALLGEDEQNCIDHAASGFVHRVRAFFDSLVLGEMNWLKKCPEYNTLLDFQPKDEEQRVLQNQGIDLVKDYIRGRIYWLQCRFHVIQLKGQTFKLQSATNFLPGLPAEFYMAFNSFALPMRIFTRTFWSSLAQTEFQVGNSNIRDSTDANRNFHNPWNDDSRRLQELYDTNPELGICEIQYIDLIKFGRRFDDILKGVPIADQQGSVQGGVPTTVTNQLGSNGPNASPDRLDLTGLSSSTATDIRSLLEPAGQPSKRVTFQDTQARSIQKRRKLSVEDDLIGPAASSDAQTTQLPFRTRDSNQSPSVLLEAPSALAPLSQEDAMLSSLEETLVMEREYALNLEIENVTRHLGRTDFTVEESKNLFNWFTPIYQQRSADGRVLYTGFIDKTRPIGKPIRVFHPQPERGMMPVVEHGIFASDVVSIGQQSSSGYANLPAVSSGLRHANTANSGWSSDDGGFTSPILSQPNLYFDINKLLTEASRSLQSILEPILQPAHLFHDGYFIPIDLTDTLVSLEDDEFKFLPLWAGGLNDGTAGVFNEVDVPDLERGGFRGGKRGISNVTGHSATSTFGADDSMSTTDNSFSDIGSEAQGTTARASHFAARDHDGDTVVSYKTASDATAYGGRAFPGQQEIYDEIQRIKLEKEKDDRDRKGKGKGKAREEVLTSLTLRQHMTSSESDAVLVDRADATNPNGAIEMDEDQNADDDDGETSTVQGGAGSSDDFVDFDVNSDDDNHDNVHEEENERENEGDSQQPSTKQPEKQDDEEWEDLYSAPY